MSAPVAYWIAFGPHGPRKLPDPGEKWIILRWTLGCITASAIIFGTGRYFAKPPPKTMTKEWQEMSNEYLKVRPSCTLRIPGSAMNGTLTRYFPTGTKVRGHHRCIVSGLQGSWYGAERSQR